MPKVKTPRAPVQDRSRQTLERIVRAVETLLETRPFDAIGVDDIARRARCSTGSFYARFPSKESLLPYVYARYDAELKPRMAAAVSGIDWSTMTLRELCDRAAAEMCNRYTERRYLLRAMSLYARAKADAIDADTKARRVELHEMPARLLARYATEITHADPLAAARTGLFIIAAAARDKILFAEAPHASSTPISDTQLKQELGRALYAYLTCK